VEQPGAGRVGVVFDRYSLFLDVVANVLRTTGVRVAAKVTTTADAAAQVDAHDADVLVAGVENDGEAKEVIALVRDTVARRPELKVILLSALPARRLAAEAFEAGAAAFVSRNGSADDVAVAVRQAYAPSIHFASHGATPELAGDDAPASVLTEREVEILRRVARGQSNAEIARALSVTVQTVKFHVSNVFRKLGVSNRTQASSRARAMKLVRDDTQLHVQR
jgi:two-component system, NarL family, response regulator DevR